MDTTNLERRATSVARELCHQLAPTCRSCPLRELSVKTEPDPVSDSLRVQTEVRCGGVRFAACPDELTPGKLEDGGFSAKDMGMHRTLKMSAWRHNLLIPALELHGTRMMETPGNEALEEFFAKYIDHEILEVDDDVIDSWWSLLGHLNGLKHSWHGDAYEDWQSAKHEYLTAHVVEVKRSQMAGPDYTGSMCEPTTYMKGALPPALHRRFMTKFSLEPTQDHRPARVVHPPGSRPNGPKQFEPKPPPRYHNWGAWGS